MLVAAGPARGPGVRLRDGGVLRRPGMPVSAREVPIQCRDAVVAPVPPHQIEPLRPGSVAGTRPLAAGRGRCPVRDPHRQVPTLAARGPGHDLRDGRQRAAGQAKAEAAARRAATALLGGETHIGAARAVAPVDSVGPRHLQDVGAGAGGAVVVNEAAADAATRLPDPILQTLLGTEELTIPGPKVDEAPRAAGSRHRQVIGFVPVVRYPCL